jgi:hypothetical protein
MDRRSKPVSSRPTVNRAPAAAARWARSVASTKDSAFTVTCPSGVLKVAETSRPRWTSTPSSRHPTRRDTPAACRKSRRTRSALRTSTPSEEPILRTNSRTSPPYRSSPAESQVRSKVLTQLWLKAPPTKEVGSASTTLSPRKAAATAAVTPWGVAPYTKRSAVRVRGWAWAGETTPTTRITQAQPTHQGFPRRTGSPLAASWRTDTPPASWFLLPLDRSGAGWATIPTRGEDGDE